jgi:hypothetical protein
MSDDHLRELHAETMDLSTSRGEDACPSLEDLSALVEGAIPESERLRLADHIMACRACQREFELLRSLKTAAPKRQRRVGHLALAASVILIAGSAGLWTTLTRNGPQGPLYRSGVPQLTLVSPSDGEQVVLPSLLTWHELPGAVSYEIEILDPTGALVFSAAALDTTYALSPGAHVVGGQYTWHVSAVFEDGTQTPSLPRSINITP